MPNQSDKDYSRTEELNNSESNQQTQNISNGSRKIEGKERSMIKSKELKIMNDYAADSQVKVALRVSNKNFGML